MMRYCQQPYISQICGSLQKVKVRVLVCVGAPSVQTVIQLPTKAFLRTCSHHWGDTWLILLSCPAENSVWLCILTVLFTSNMPLCAWSRALAHEVLAKLNIPKHASQGLWAGPHTHETDVLVGTRRERKPCVHWEGIADMLTSESTGSLSHQHRPLAQAAQESHHECPWPCSWENRSWMHVHSRWYYKNSTQDFQQWQQFDHP